MADLFDINNTANFQSWWNATIRELGATQGGGFTQRALREGILDDEVQQCNFPNDYRYSAPGKTVNGLVRPQELTIAQLRALTPIAAGRRADVVAGLEKIRTTYMRDCVTSINYIKMRMASHTLDYFEEVQEFTEAVDRKDLVMLGHVIKSRGIVGTGNPDEARQKLETDIYRGDDSLKLSNSGGKGFDFNLHSLTWRRIDKALKELGSTIGSKAMIKGYVLSLPGKSIKTLLSMDSSIASLEAAISKVREVIVAQNVSLTDSASAFLIEDDQSVGFKRKGIGEIDGGALELMVAAAVIDGLAKESARKKQAYVDKRKIKKEDEKTKQMCRDFEKARVCDYEKRKGTPCRYNHGERFSSVGGVVRPITIAAPPK